MRKKVLFWGALAVCALALLLFLLWLFAIHSLFQSWSERPYLYEENSISPDSKYSIAVWRSEGIWPFGPALAKVTASDGDMEGAYETEIFDDGGQGGVHIFWLDENTARVVLSGSEQTDETVTITFPGGTPVLETVKLPRSDVVPEGMQEGLACAVGQLKVQDGEYAFWVGLYEGESGPDVTVAVVYDLYEQNIVQEFEDPLRPVDAVRWSEIKDMDGDGYADFYYRTGGDPVVYLWDPLTERFVRSLTDGQKIAGEEMRKEKNRDEP